MYTQQIYQFMFHKHRVRVLHAHSLIDNTPPIVFKDTITKISYHKADAKEYNRLILENKDNLINMNRILRTNGALDTFQHLKEFRNARIANAIDVIKKQQTQNCILGHRIIHADSLVKTHRPLTDKDRERIRKADEFDLPEKILSKYETLHLPKNMHMKHLLLRPTIYFEMSIAGIWPLGRVVIELFTEACPQVVLEFARFCIDNDKDRLKFVHLYPKLWLEGELELDDITLNTHKIEYDMRAIDHGRPGSVLSFSREYLKGFYDGYINFSMSFKPLSVLNGRRVGFGRVVQGNKLLTSLKDFGNKVGKARKKIVLDNCGLL